MDIKLAPAIDDNNPIAGDIYLGNDSSPVLTTTLSEQVAQQLYIRFKFFRGEWFLDETVGFPWFQLVLGQKTPIDIVAQLIRQLILTTPGVKSLESLEMGTVTAARSISPRFSCTLDNGAVLTSDSFSAFVIGGV